MASSSEEFAAHAMEEMMNEESISGVTMTLESVYRSELQHPHHGSQGLIDQFRALLKAEPGGPEIGPEEVAWYDDDATLRRFLVARNCDLPKAREMLMRAAAWRAKRKPHRLAVTPKDPYNFEHEACTGKIRISGRDRWGRPILVLHNTVQNTSDVDNQMRFLAWNMDSLAADMYDGVEKYCILIHLWDFSLFNCPPMTSTRETLEMLTTCCEYSARRPTWPPTETWTPTPTPTLNPKPRTPTSDVSNQTPSGWVIASRSVHQVFFTLFTTWSKDLSTQKRKER